MGYYKELALKSQENEYLESDIEDAMKPSLAKSVDIIKKNKKMKLVKEEIRNYVLRSKDLPVEKSINHMIKCNVRYPISDIIEWLMYVFISQLIERNTIINNQGELK